MIQSKKAKKEEADILFMKIHGDVLKDTSRAKKVNYEIYWNRQTWGERFDYSEGKIYDGALMINKFLNSLNLRKAIKKEAQILIIIGEQTESGAWIIGKAKRHYFDYLSKP